MLDGRSRGPTRGGSRGGTGGAAAPTAEPYDSAAIFRTAGGESVRGRSAIEALMRERFARGGRVIGGRIVQDGLVPAGTMLFEWGHVELKLGAGGGAGAPPRPHPTG